MRKSWVLLGGREDSLLGHLQVDSHGPLPVSMHRAAAPGAPLWPGAQETHKSLALCHPKPPPIPHHASSA